VTDRPTDAPARQRTLWETEFERECAEVRLAAEDWGVRWNEPEGRLISTLLGAIRKVADVGRSSHAVMESIARASKEAAQADLRRAQALREAAELELLQVRTLKAGLIVEHENVTLRMISEVFPMFAEKLKSALVIRERAWNRGVEHRRFALAGASVLAVFLAGVGLEMWRDWDRVAAFNQCLTHAFVSNGRAYCAIPGWEQEDAATQKQ
jgi:hypothetical protein